ADVHQIQAVLDHAQDQGADECTDDGAAAPEEACSPDDHGGDRGEFEEVTGGRVRRVRLPGHDDGCDPGAHAAEDIHRDQHSIHRDAHPARCFGVATDGIDP